MSDGLSVNEVVLALAEYWSEADARELQAAAERFVEHVCKAHLVYRIERGTFVVVNKHGRECRMTLEYVQLVEDRVLYALLVAFAINVTAVQIGCGQVLQLDPEVAWQQPGSTD